LYIPAIARDAISGIAGWNVRSVDHKEGTPIRLKADKGSKQRSREQCKAQTKAGDSCPAPAVQRGLCFFHANPDKLSEMGRQGGSKNRHANPDDCDLQHRQLKTIADVSTLLEETINRVRKGPFDLRAANSIGFLAEILLKGLERGRLEDRLDQLEAAIAGTPGAEREMFDFKLKEEQQHEEPKTTPEEN
jgi:hypothetical protein